MDCEQAKTSLPDLFLNLLRSCALQCHLKIVNGCGAVHRDSSYETGSHQVVEYGRQANFDYVTAEAPDYRFARGSGIKNRANQTADAFASKNVRKFRYESENVFGTIHRFCEHFRAHLAFAGIERVRGNTGEIDWFDAIFGVHN